MPKSRHPHDVLSERKSEDTEQPRTTYMLYNYTKTQAAASPTMDEAAAWVFDYSLFLFPVLFRRHVGEFLEDTIQIFLVVVPDQPRNRRSAPVSRLQQRFGGIDPQAVQVVDVFHPGFFFKQGRQIGSVDLENIRPETQSVSNSHPEMVNDYKATLFYSVSENFCS